jgi:hypothetical protein
MTSCDRRASGSVPHFHFRTERTVVHHSVWRRLPPPLVSQPAHKARCAAEAPLNVKSAPGGAPQGTSWHPPRVGSVALGGRMGDTRVSAARWQRRPGAGPEHARILAVTPLR